MGCEPGGLCEAGKSGLHGGLIVGSGRTNPAGQDKDRGSRESLRNQEGKGRRRPCHSSLDLAYLGPRDTGTLLISIFPPLYLSFLAPSTTSNEIGRPGSRARGCQGAGASSFGSTPGRIRGNLFGATAVDFLSGAVLYCGHTKVPASLR
jgi:hypothetical protein